MAEYIKRDDAYIYLAEYHCSECKKEPLLNEDGDTILSKYCPSCGAVMRNGGDDDV